MDRRVEQVNYEGNYHSTTQELLKITRSIVPNSFWAMSDLENPSNKSDFYVKNGLNRTEI